MRVTVDGQPVTLEPAPIVRAGRLFVPLRGIFEAVGASVVFSSGQINATGNGHTVSLNLGSRQAFVDGQQERLDAAPFLVGSSLYVPLRFVSQALGTLVDYDPRSERVAISTGIPQTSNQSVALSPAATATPVAATPASPTPAPALAERVASTATVSPAVTPAAAPASPARSPSPQRVAVATAPPTPPATPRPTPSPVPQRMAVVVTAPPTPAATPRPTPSLSSQRVAVVVTAPPTPAATLPSLPLPSPKRIAAIAAPPTLAPTPRPTPNPKRVAVVVSAPATPAPTLPPTPPPRPRHVASVTTSAPTPAAPHRQMPPPGPKRVASAGTARPRPAARPRPTPRPKSTVRVVLEHPANGTSVRISRPMVRASFVKGTVNPNRVRVAFDGRDVTQAAYVSAHGISYTPLSPIPPGRHEVRVQGADRSGATFAQNWRFRSGSVAPVITIANVAPRPGGTVGQKFTVRGRTTPGAIVTIQVSQTSQRHGLGQFFGKMFGFMHPARAQRTVTAGRNGRFVSLIDINAPKGTMLGIVITSTDSNYGVVATPLRFSVRTQ
jgi:Copper amine oxidase N-terminal domain